jgi:hypothetical protein
MICKNCIGCGKCNNISRHTQSKDKYQRLNLAQLLGGNYNMGQPKYDDFMKGLKPYNPKTAINPYQQLGAIYQNIGQAYTALGSAYQLLAKSYMQTATNNAYGGENGTYPAPKSSKNSGGYDSGAKAQGSLY